MHGSPFDTVRVILEEEVILSCEKDKTIRIVEPSTSD
jgi:hypothetical protein